MLSLLTLVAFKQGHSALSFVSRPLPDLAHIQQLQDKWTAAR